MNKRDRERLAKLFGMLGSTNQGEAENARKKLLELLKRYNKTWNDIQELLRDTAPPRSGTTADPGDAPAVRQQPDISPADLVNYMIEKYIDVTPHQAVAITLWMLHTHVYDRFMVSPRLALTSPVRGCGKTTLLDIAEQLTARGAKTDSITAAAIYHLVDSKRATLLLDEADNMDTAANKLLKAVLNSGHRKGATRMHMVEGWPQKFSIYAPMALAAIGLLPLPLMHRSVVVEMTRATRNDLKRLDTNDAAVMADLRTVYREVIAWARDVTLEADPAIPPELRNRPADNWRPLIAIADSCGAAWGKLAREAALALSKDRPDEDPGVTLLTDIRAIYDRRQTDRLPSATLVADLIAFDDGLWSEWRGPHDNQQPRKLSQMELSRLLRPFKIKSRTIRLPSGTARGYLRQQFEAAWAAYCAPGDTTTQSSIFKQLLGA